MNFSEPDIYQTARNAGFLFTTKLFERVVFPCAFFTSRNARVFLLLGELASLLGKYSLEFLGPNSLSFPTSLHLQKDLKADALS